MTNSTVAELRQKNSDLCQLVIRLSTIVLRNVVEQRELAVIRGDEINSRMVAAVTPVESVARLREAAMHCSQLSTRCPDGPATQTLEQLGIELAAEAEGLEALLRMSDADV